MLKVALTIDTEFWPCDGEWPDHTLPRPLTGLDEAYRRGVLGRTAAGDFGVPYLLQSLARHHLHGVFFVESLSSSAVGDEWLRRTVRAITDSKQEVQLHLHTEWLSEISVPGLPLKVCQNLGEYSLEEQTAIVRHGLANLRAAGAHDVSALRAGNMGGSGDTPAAARAAGLSLDMSFDPTRGSGIRALLESMRGRPASADACPTVPLSFVEDYPGHYRPAQLTALSFREMRRALFNAAREEWPCFVILLHSFELVRSTVPMGPLRRHWINIARWNNLCSFLAQHRDQFTTIGCPALSEGAEFTRLPTPSSRTLALDTAWRLGEQIASRFI